MGLRTKFNPLGGKNLPFAKGEILWQAVGDTQATQWLDIPKGVYKLTAVGAGGTCAEHLNLYAVMCYAGGGSGGFVACDVKIPKGRYLFFPGATNVRNAGVLAEDGTEMFIAYNGSNAYQQSNTLTPVAAGAGGGVLYPSKFEIVNQYYWAGGNNGTYVVGSAAAGGASVEPINGFGKGAGTGETPVQGFIKIEYVGNY